MYKKFGLFTTSSNFIKICTELSDWNDILYHYSTIYLKEDDWEKNEFIFELSKQGYDINHFNVADLSEKVLSCCSPALALNDIPHCFVDYGVICLKEADSVPKHLTQAGWSVDPTENDSRTWISFFDGKEPEINSLVISDKYFFCDSTENCDNALDNLWDILTCNIPDNIENKIFQVAIVADIKEATKNGSPTELFANLAYFLKDTAERFSAKIQFELISLEGHFWKKSELHDRRILSNYFMVNASKNLKAFSQGVRESQTVDFKYIFSKDSEKSTTPLHTMSLYLDNLSDAISRTYAEQKQYALIENGEVKITSYSNSIKKSINRLLL